MIDDCALYLGFVGIFADAHLVVVCLVGIHAVKDLGAYNLGYIMGEQKTGPDIAEPVVPGPTGLLVPGPVWLA